MTGGPLLPSGDDDGGGGSAAAAPGADTTTSADCGGQPAPFLPRNPTSPEPALFLIVPFPLFPSFPILFPVVLSLRIEPALIRFCSCLVSFLVVPASISSYHSLLLITHIEFESFYIFIFLHSC